MMSPIKTGYKNINFHESTLIILFTTLMVSIAFCEPALMSKQAPSWKSEDLDTRLVMSRIAHDFECTSETTLVAMESWEKNSCMIYDEKTNVASIGINPKLEEFSIDTTSKTYSAVLQEVAEKSTEQSWMYNKCSDILDLAETNLLNDKRWPLNSTLGNEENKAMNYQEALELLIKKYGLLRARNRNVTLLLENPEQYELLKKTVVWPPRDAGDGLTVRTLVLSMIRAAVAAQPKLKGRLFFIGVLPNSDPREGYAGLKDRKELQWTLGALSAVDDKTMREMISYKKESREQAKKQYGNDVPYVKSN